MNKKLLKWLGIPLAGIIGLASFNMFEFKDGTLTIYFSPQEHLSKKTTINEEDNNEEEVLDNIESSDNSQNNDSYDNSKENNEEKYVTINFEHYELEFNCERGGYNHFSYNTVEDGGQHKRYPTFLGYKEIGNLCNYSEERYKLSQKTSTYKSPKGALTYDRGHGVHQNIWDHNKEFMKQTNYMINIVPHESKQNRQGLWRYAEKLTECLRDNYDLYVIGGNIWGNDTTNDYFFDTHNVQTPDKLFKIIVNDKDVHAWIIPNDRSANSRNAKKYAVSIDDIEKSIGYTFSSIDDNIRYKKGTTPSLPRNCSLK